MEHTSYKIGINAPREKIWTTLWTLDSYEQWAAAFMEGSTVKTDWQKGSKAYFVDAEGSGMVSRIVENKPNEFLSINHLGIVKGGVEDYDSEEAKKWASGFENYTLKDANGGTELQVDLTGAIPPEYKDYFANAWPKALNKIKELSEA